MKKSSMQALICSLGMLTAFTAMAAEPAFSQYGELQSAESRSGKINSACTLIRQIQSLQHDKSLLKGADEACKSSPNLSPSELTMIHSSLLVIYRLERKPTAKDAIFSAMENVNDAMHLAE